MKRLTALLLAAVLVFAVPVWAKEAPSEGIAVYVDGLTVAFDVPPRLVENRAMVPLRALFEALGAQVSWDPDSRTVLSEKDGVSVTVGIGNDYLTKNGETVLLEVPAYVADNRTLVPLRAVTESFNCQVFWEEERRVVRVVTVALTAPVSGEEDMETVLTLGDKKVSRAEYALYEGLLTDDSGKVPERNDVEEALLQIYAAGICAEKMGFLLPEEEADGVRYDVAMMQKSGAYATLLKEYGTTDKALRKFLMDTAQAAYLKEQFTDCSDGEIVAYARENFVRVKQIMTSTRASAELAMAELEAGVPFESVLRKYGIDLYDQSLGYVFGRGDRTPAFEEAAFALLPGEISEIVETPFGYHIIKRYSMEEVSDAYLLSKDREKICEALSNQKYADLLRPYCEQLRPTSVGD